MSRELETLLAMSAVSNLLIARLMRALIDAGALEDTALRKVFDEAQSGILQGRLPASVKPVAGLMLAEISTDAGLPRRSN